MKLTYIIYDLNKIFDKLKKYILEIHENNIEKLDRFNLEYVEKIKNYDFTKYNKKYVRIPKKIC